MEGGLGNDPHNCGACGHDCSGGHCAAGVCEPFTLVPGPDAGGTPVDIAVDDTYVYWASDDGTVHRAAKAAPGASTILASFTGASGTARNAVDDAGLYYANETTVTVYLVAKDGTSRAPLYVEEAGWTPAGVTSNGKALFWAHASGSTVGGIMTKSLAGSGAPAREIWGDRRYPQELVADDRFVYWAENFEEIFQGSVDGTGKVTLLAGWSPYASVAMDDASVFWTSDAGLVASTPKGVPAGGSPFMAPGTETLATDTAPPFGIAVGGGFVAWTDPAAGEVRAVAADGVCSGTCVRTLATGQKRPGRAAADDKAVYWLNAGDRSLAKVAF